MIEGPPAVESLLPHRDPMRLVRVIVEASADAITCIAVIPGDNSLAVGENAPACLGLEAAAQAAAALEALARRAEGGQPSPRLGYLVGVRDAVFHVPDLPVGEPLAVTVRAAGNAGPLSVYEARVELAGRLLVTGTVSTYVTE
jgi:predicted hotdog family 3-hydroxylacyl-ACP dehydratase